jgi:hypothetical protein
MNDLRATARRSGTNRRRTERRGWVAKRQTIETDAIKARHWERRTSLRRLQYRRSLLDRRAAAPPR